jgi:primosomal protein DnaI
MKSISQVIQKQFPKSMMDRFIQFEEDLMKHPSVMELKQKYPDKFTNHPRSFAMNDLWQYTLEQNHCSNCPGLAACENIFKGHHMVVKEDHFSGGHFAYSPCDLHKGWEQQQRITKNIQSHHVHSHILNMTFQKLEMDTRREVIKAAMKFCTTFEKGKTVRGMYLHGMMGFGKSAIAGAMTQELAKRGVDVIMVYVPDFLEELKDSFKSGDTNDKLKAMKKVSVLILDDIGAESLSSWARDNVLGAILNDRMEKLPTVFTSNLTIRELEQHFLKAKNKNDKEDHVKSAKRVMERIEPFVDTYHVLSTNWRRKQAHERALS